MNMNKHTHKLPVNDENKQINISASFVLCQVHVHVYFIIKLLYLVVEGNEVTIDDYLVKFMSYYIPGGDT